MKYCLEKDYQYFVPILCDGPLGEADVETVFKIKFTCLANL